MKKIVTAVISCCLLFFITEFVSAKEYNIDIQAGRYMIDSFKMLILCHEIPADITDTSITSLTITFDHKFFFFSIPNKFRTDTSYMVEDYNYVYYLYFTELPIISIDVAVDIPDEPKVPANFTITESGGNVFSSPVGIELHGGVSQGYPKKSYTVEFRIDSSSEESKDVSFFCMRSDDDWYLNALYIQPLRLREVVSEELWLKIHQIYYHDKEPNAVCGIRGRYVEVFVNGRYNGVYYFCEFVDKKQLKLKDFEDDLIKGELYKASGWGEAVSYYSLEDFDNSSRIWSGFELKYPEDSDTTDWRNIYNFVELVTDEPDSEFMDRIYKEFDYSNLVDYFIFLNLIRAADNTGKNIYVAKYDAGEKYFNTPWDLDGTWGIAWYGGREEFFDGILSNGLYGRLVWLDAGSFRHSLYKRWTGLRKGVLNTDSILTLIKEKHDYLLKNNIYKREFATWTESIHSSDDFEYMNNWAIGRLLFLDDYFNSINTAISDENLTEDRNFFIFPNPAEDYLIITPNYDYPGKYSLEIYDLYGSGYMSDVIDIDTGLDFRINLSGLPAGIYTIVIRSGNNISAKRFIKL